MFSLDLVEWLIILVCAFLIGLTKTGIPGLGILVMPLMADIFPAKESIGIVLPMLMFADLFAVAYYRRHAVWKHLVRIMPWTAIGIFIGYLLLGSIGNRELKTFIGIVVLSMLGLKLFWDRRGNADSVPKEWWFAAGLGLLAGVTTMMANAAGSLMVIYLLAMRLPKTEFVGTGAWYFLVLNWFKVPFSLNLGLITGLSLQFDFLLFPAIAIGALVGIMTLNRISQKGFSTLVQILAAISAIRLLLPG